MTIEETLASVVSRFNRHADRTPALQQELKGLHRTITVHITDGDRYSVELKDGHLTELRSGGAPKADLTITTDTETFDGLVKKEIGPMKALVLRKITIDGTLEDKLLFRKLL